MESKDDIRKRIGRSTDDGDAMVQAFWQEGIVAPIDWARMRPWPPKPKAEEAAAGITPEPSVNGRQNGHAPPEAPEPAEAPLTPAEARRKARDAAFQAGTWV